MRIGMIRSVLLIMMIPYALAAEQGIGLILGEPTGITWKRKNIVVAAGWSGISRYDDRIDLITDWWLINDHFTEICDWYLAIGGEAGMETSLSNENSPALYMGARVPVGIQWWMSKGFELFGEIAPTVLAYPAVDLEINAGIGLRYHF